MPSRHHLRSSLLIMPLLLAVLLYGYTVQLPFYLDDGLLFRMIQDHPGGVDGFKFWGGAPSFSYYRPLGFSIWEINGLLLNGRYDPVGLHLLNVFLYGITGSALASLVRRLSDSISTGLIAGMAFVIFPFNYNAVMWVASLFHLLAMMGIITGILFGLRALDGERSGLSVIVCAVATVIAVFSAVFSHENGVLILPLFALLLLILDGWRVLRNRRAWGIGLMMGAIVAVYGYLFLTVPRPGADAQFRPEMFADNLGIFLQGLVYPVAAMVRRLTLAEADTLLFFGMTAITVIPGMVFLWRVDKKAFRLAGYGLLWYGLAALPSTLFLETDYIIGSWRLMLIVSPGAAIWWSVLLVSLWRAGSKTGQRMILLRRGMVILIVVWSSVISVLFLAQRRQEALLQADYLRQLQTEIDEHAGEKPLVINAPSFITASDENRLFLTVGMGVIFTADFAGYDLLFSAESGSDYPYIDGLAYYQILGHPDWMSYAPLQTYGPVDFTEHVRLADSIFATIFTKTGDFYPMYVGKPDPPESWDTTTAPQVRFAEAGVDLLWTKTYLSDETTLILHTRWRVTDPQAVEPSFRVYCDDVMVGESTWMVWGNSHPYRVWQTGEEQTDRREIQLSQPVSADCVRVTVSLVDEMDNTQVIADSVQIAP